MPNSRVVTQIRMMNHPVLLQGTQEGRSPFIPNGAASKCKRWIVASAVFAVATAVASATAPMSLMRFQLMSSSTRQGGAPWIAAASCDAARPLRPQFTSFRLLRSKDPAFHFIKETAAQLQVLQAPIFQNVVRQPLLVIAAQREERYRVNQSHFLLEHLCLQGNDLIRI